MVKFRALRTGFLWCALALAVLLAAATTALASSADAVWPESSGTNVQSGGKLVVDASHMDQGYVMCRVASPSKHGLKMRVVYGDTQLMYSLNQEAEYEVIPLQLGSGRYEFALYENVKGSKYSAEGKVSLSVQLSDEDAAYLVTNQYVDYDLYTAAVQKSDELCQGMSAAQDRFNIITRFMTSEFAYDFVRAKTISPGQLPEIDYCYENRMGICQDLSAVMVCMLRVQGVPCKLVIGYADKYYHAWTSTVIDGQEVFFDPTAAINALSAKKYTVERIY